MTRREYRILMAGLLLGAVGAVAIAGGVSLLTRRSSLAPVESTANTEGSISTEASGGVQLSPEEQTKIGIQTSVIQPESLSRDIVAIGRVEEAGINAGEAPVKLTDPKGVWVKTNIFDSDISKIRPGLAATITSDVLPEAKLSGIVAFIDSHSDPQTRTTPVRIEVENTGSRLKPGMIVQSTFHIRQGTTLAVPRNAVLDNGTEKIVYLARETGVFEARTIQVGEPAKDFFPVLAGLKSGDTVVTNGVFLVDSQSRLTGGLTGMFGGSKSYSGTPTPAASGNGARMTFRIEPDPPAGAKENTIHVALLDKTGKPIPDAKVRLTFVMPAMPTMNMPEMRNGAELKWTGTEYAGPIQIMMSGGWNVSVEARRGNDVLATVQTHVNAR